MRTARTLTIFAVCCLGFQADTRAGERKWPPNDIRITRPTTQPIAGASVVRIEYTVMKDEQPHPVVILTTSTKFTLDLTAENQRKKIKSLDPPSAADLTIYNGWLYIIGKNSSVGSGTVVAAAESSKLIVVAADQPTDPALIGHPGPPDDKPAKCWRTDRGEGSVALNVHRVAQQVQGQALSVGPVPEADSPQSPWQTAWAQISAACQALNVTAPEPMEP